MKHNDVINSFRKHIPAGTFFHYLPKSMYNSNPFDCLMITKSYTFALEFKCANDIARPHQLEAMRMINRYCRNATGFFIYGGIKSKGQLIRNYVRIVTAENVVLFDGSYKDAVNYLINYTESTHGKARTAYFDRLGAADHSCQIRMGRGECE